MLLELAFSSDVDPCDTAPAKEETAEELNERLKKLMTKSNVVLFMKGEPDEPRCGFSRTIVKLLRDEKVEFTHFDILTDESVRSGSRALQLSMKPC